MISIFSDAVHLILDRSHPRHVFFRIWSLRFCLATTSFRWRASRRRFLTSSVVAARAVSPASFFTSFHKIFWPFVVNALGNTLSIAYLGNAVFASRFIKHDPVLLLRKNIVCGWSVWCLNDLPPKAFAGSSYLSYFPLLIDYDEPKTICYQNKAIWTHRSRRQAWIAVG